MTIFATGTMVYQSLQAAKKLAEEGIECAVINMHTLSPLDKEIIDSFCRDCRLVVTAEEGFVTGGLGAAVAEALVQSRKRTPPMQIIGLEGFPHAGSYKYMLEQTGLDAAHIATRIRTALQ